MSPGETTFLCVPERAEPRGARDGGPPPALTRCPACGSLRILPLLERAVREAGFAEKDVLLVSSLCCWADWSGPFRPYGFRASRGSAFATALGAKLANPDLAVVAFEPLADLRIDPALLRRAAGSSGLVRLLVETGEEASPAAPLVAALEAGAGLLARFRLDRAEAAAGALSLALREQGLSWIQLADRPAPAGEGSGEAGPSALESRDAALTAVAVPASALPFGVLFRSAARPRASFPSPMKSGLGLTPRQQRELLRAHL